jgi:hypothetical protein
VSWISVLQILWPIAVTVLPFVVGGGFLWLKTQFPTKGELDAVRAEISRRIEEHAKRFERGSTKFAEHDRRLALVEDDCESSPSKGDLNQGMTVLAGRMSGVESAMKGVERQLNTQHDYLRTIIDKGLGAGAGK